MIIGLAGVVSSIIIIAIGAWMRRSAEAQELRDRDSQRQTELLERMADKLDEEKESNGNYFICSNSRLKHDFGNNKSICSRILRT